MNCAVKYVHKTEIQEKSSDSELCFVILKTGNFKIRSLIVPNPVTDFFQISGISKVVNMVLVDLTGKKVKEFSTDHPRYNLDQVNPGKYFLFVTDLHNQTQVLKLIRE